MVQKVWLITGIARGLGHALAKAALARCDLVVGTTRRGEQPDGLAADNLTVLPLEMTDSEQTMTIDAAVQGMGIAFWIEQELKPLIEQGKLVPLLEQYSAPFPGFYICYPQQRQMAPALRAFIDFIKIKAAER